MKRKLEDLTPDELQQYAKLNKQRQSYRETIKEQEEIIKHIEEKIDSILDVSVPETEAETEFYRGLEF